MPSKFRLALSLFIVAVLFSSCEKSNGSIGSGKFVDDRPELGEICAVSSSMHEKFTKIKAERKAAKEGKSKK